MALLQWAAMRWTQVNFAFTPCRAYVFTQSIHITVGSTWLLCRAGYGALSRAGFWVGLPSPPLDLAVHLAKMQAPAQVHSRGSVVRVGVGVVGVVGVVVGVVGVVGVVVGVVVDVFADVLSMLVVMSMLVLTSMLVVTLMVVVWWWR